MRHYKIFIFQNIGNNIRGQFGKFHKASGHPKTKTNRFNPSSLYIYKKKQYKQLQNENKKMLSHRRLNSKYYYLKKKLQKVTGTY